MYLALICVLMTPALTARIPQMVDLTTMGGMLSAPQVGGGLRCPLSVSDPYLWRIRCPLQLPSAPRHCTTKIRSKMAWGVATAAYQVCLQGHMNYITNHAWVKYYYINYHTCMRE